MTTTHRRRSASLALRLGALVLVPTVALGAFAAQRIQSELDDADRAGEVAAAVDLQRHISAVYPPAQVEKVALEGLARMDALGLQRELIVAVIGVDFEATYETNSAAVHWPLPLATSRPCPPCCVAPIETRAAAAMATDPSMPIRVR